MNVKWYNFVDSEYKLFYKNIIILLLIEKLTKY